MKKVISFLAITLLIIGFSIPAFAAPVPIPNTVVLGTDVFVGPSHVIASNFDPSDTIDLTAIGIVDLASGQFSANAAGVIISPPVTNTGHNPGQTAPGPNSSPYAALMVSKNGGPLVPFFPADATTGFGNPIPPTTITASRTLSSLFGGGLLVGDTIQFRINDINTGDNTGQFDISQNVLPPELPVGGESLSIDKSSLFLVGLTSSSIWLVPTITGLASAGFLIIKLRKR